MASLLPPMMARNWQGVKTVLKLAKGSFFDVSARSIQSMFELLSYEYWCVRYKNLNTLISCTTGLWLKPMMDCTTPAKTSNRCEPRFSIFFNGSQALQACSIQSGSFLMAHLLANGLNPKLVPNFRPRYQCKSSSWEFKNFFQILV